ncbi:spore cortex biosynthesis protein YabQ [Bacillus sp. 1P06AnD]|uniref:spore cortex biosynthesis protein YabQ n=1 Tax=Bacillus sp. 1P06AnD TaxID=3132208 RepID=UPI0039A24C27
MTLTTQFYTLWSMIAMGMCFGASLDTYQLFLKRPKRSRITVFIHDVLFWLIQAIAVFYILLLVNQGELRFYAFLALVCGFAAYQALMKKVYMLLLNGFIEVVKAAYRLIKKTIFMLVIQPIIWILLAAAALIKSVWKILFSLFRTFLRMAWFIIRVVFAPIVWILRLICKLLPKSFTNQVLSLYNHCKGFYVRAKKYIKRVLSEWKTRKNNHKKE